MDSMQIKKLEGRLFTQEGMLAMIVSTDPQARTARVSIRLDGEHQVLEMDVDDVQALVASEPRVIMESLRDPAKKERIREEDDGWYFHAREGRLGPFDSRKAAEDEMQKFIRAAAA